MATVSDNFNRANGNLDGSTASGGGLWVEFENAGWSSKVEYEECSQLYILLKEAYTQRRLLAHQAIQEASAAEQESEI